MALAVVVLFAGIGLRDPWPSDEPRYVQVAREMLESGQWLFPTRGSEPYPDKPPLFMWLIAFFYALVGELRIAFLLPSALAGLGTLWLVLDLGRRLWGIDIGRTAVLVLLLTPQFLLQAKTAQIDALACFWITLGCYGLIRHFLLGPSWGWYAVVWVAMAMGIMSKGVGFLPMLMLLPLAAWAKNANGASEQKPWRARLWWGPALMLATLALWLVPMWLAVEASGNSDLLAYRDELLFRQTAERYTSAWHHVKPWHFYLTTAIPVAWLPLAVLCALEAPRFVRMWGSNPPLRVLLVWVGLVLLFFSASSGKRDVYILPALPMLSLAVAYVWERGDPPGGKPITVLLLRLLTCMLALLVLVLAALALLAPAYLPPKAQPYLDAIEALAPGLAIIGLATPLLLWLTRRRPVLEQLALTSLAVWLCLALLVLPAANPYRTPEQVMQRLEQTVPPASEVGLLAFKEQHLLFSRRPLVHFSYLAPLSEQERNAWAWMREDPTRVLLASDELQLTCFDISKHRSLGEAHRRHWIVLDASAMRGQCEPPAERKRYRYVPRRKDILS